MNFVISLIAAYLIKEEVNQMARASSMLVDDVKDWATDIKDSVKSRMNRPPAKKPKSEVRVKWEKLIAEKKKN